MRSTFAAFTAALIVCSFCQPVSIHAQDTKEPLFLKGHKGAIYYIEYSKDGKKLATATSRIVETGLPDGGEIMVWDTATGKQLFSFLEPRTSLRLIRFHPDGKRLLTISDEGAMRLWDVENGKNHVLLGKTGTRDIAFSPDGKIIVYGGEFGAILAYYLETKKTKQIAKLPRAIYNIIYIEFSPDGKTFATTYNEGKAATVYEVATGNEVHTVDTRGGTRLIFTPDSKRLITWGFRSYVWDLSTGKELYKFTVEGSEGLMWARLLTDGKRLVAWAPSLRTHHVWDVETGKKLLTGEPFKNGVGDYGVFSHDGKQLAISSGTLKLVAAPPVDPKK